MELDEDVEGPGPKKRYSSDNPFASAAPAAASYSADNPFAGGSTGTAVAEPEVPTAPTITALPPATPPEQVEAAKELFAQPPALRGARQPVQPLPAHPLTATVAQDVTAVPGVRPSVPALPSPSLGVTPSPALGAAAPISAEEAGADARGLEHPILNITRALGRDVGARFLLQGAQKIADVVGNPAGLEANPVLRQVVDVANRQRAAEQAGKPHVAAELSRSLIEMLGEMELLPGATAESGVAAPKILAELGGETAAKAIPALANAGADITGAITEKVPGTVAGRIARRAAEEAGRMGYVEGATGSIQEPDLDKAAERLRSGALGGLLWGAGTHALGEAASAGVKTALGRVAERNLPRRPVEEMPEPEAVPVERRLGPATAEGAPSGKGSYSPDNPFAGGGSAAAAAAPEAPTKTEPLEHPQMEAYLKRVGIKPDMIDEIMGRKEPRPFNERVAERRAAEEPTPPEGVEERRKTGRRAEPGAGELPNVPIEELPPFEQKPTVSKAVEQKPTVEQAGAGRPSEVTAPEAVTPPERTSPAAVPEKKGRQRKPSYAVEGSNPKYGKMSNDDLEDRYLELNERAEAAGKTIQEGVTPWTRDDPNMDIDAPGSTKRSGVAWSGAAGRAKGASDVAGRLMGEVEAEMKVRKIDTDGVLERAEERRALQGDTEVPEYERGKERILGLDFRKQLVTELVKSGHPEAAVASLDDRKLAGLASDLPNLTPPQESRIMDVIYGARSTLVGDKRRRYGKEPVPEPTSLELTSESEPAKPDQESLFGEKEGTAASRSLKQTEAASKSELEVLRTRLKGETDPGRRQAIAAQVADLEKLVNRDKALTAGEMATRAAAEPGFGTPERTELAGQEDAARRLTYPIDEHKIAELARVKGIGVDKAAENLKAGGYAVTPDMVEKARSLAIADLTAPEHRATDVSRQTGTSEQASLQPPVAESVTPKIERTEEGVSRSSGLRKAELDQKYGSDKALGVTKEGEDEPSRLPDGGEAVRCTDCAKYIVEQEGKGRVVGYEEGSNPTETATGAKQAGRTNDGHDFAVIDERYIVDPWVKETSGISNRAVFDLQDPSDHAEIRRLYGDPNTWEELEVHREGKNLPDSIDHIKQAALQSPADHGDETPRVGEKRADYTATPRPPLPGRSVEDEVKALRTGGNEKAADALERFMEGSKIRKVVFRGDYRADKVGTTFLKGRSTSGRFYFTEKPEIASGYATGKTYVPEEDSNFESWFKVKTGPGKRDVANLDRAWYHLTPEQQAKVKDTLLRASLDDENHVVFGEPGDAVMATDGIHHYVREARGNWLAAAKAIWLESGLIYDDEEKFLQVLQHAGLEATFDSPHTNVGGVTPVWLNVRHPLDALHPPEDFVAKVREAVKRDRSRAQLGVDMWDKRTRTLRDWAEQFEDDMKKDDPWHATWATSIPEKVVKIAQSLGYDGIADTGGKMGGEEHGVWIAFEPNQIKSAIGNRGTFSPESKSIVRDRSPEDLAKAGYDIKSDDASRTFGSAEKATDAAQFGLWTDERLPTLDERRKVVERAPRTWVDVRGKRLATPEDASVLLRPFRSPLTETMHFILKSEDDIVLAHTMETSGAVDKVAYVGDDAFERMIQGLVDRARRLGATKIDMAHNHPSGNPHPSESDLRFTAQVSGEIRAAAKKADLPVRLNRHYVIDHEAMTEISIKSSTELPEGWKTELVLHGGIKVPATGIDWTARTDHAIQMPSDVLRLIGAPVADRVDVVYRDTQGRVVAVAPHARAALKTMATWLSAEAKSLGAENAILVVGTDETLFKEAHQAAGKYKGARRIEDVVAVDKAGGEYRSAGESGLYSPHVSDDVRSARRLAEEPGDYHAGRLQPEEPVLPAAEGGTEDAGHPARDAVDLTLPKLPDLSSEAGFLKIGPIPTNLSGLYKALSETDVGDSILRLLAPAGRSPEGGRMGHIIRARRGEAERDYVVAKWALRQAIEEAPRLSTPAGLDFTDAIEAGKIGTLPPNLQPIAKALRAVLDDRRQKVQALGGSALKDFIENYFPHIWDKGAKSFLSRLMARRPLEGNKSFLKHRTIPTIREGMALKLVPMTDNPVSMVLLKLREMDKYIAAHRIWNDAKKEKLVHFFRIGAKRPDGWSKINDRIATVFAPPTDEGAMAIRGEYYAPDPVATVLNNTVSPGLRGNVLYDVLAGAGNVLNQAQLGLSFFHAGFTTYDVMVSHLAMAIEDLVDGKPGHAMKTLPSVIHAVGTNPLRGFQVRMEYRNPGSSKDPQMQEIVNALVRGGMRAEQPMEYETNAMERFAREVRQHPLKTVAKAAAGGAAGALAAGPVGAVVGAGLASRALPAALEWASGGIMKHLVPLQKNGVMAELMRRALERLGPNATQAQIDAAAADVVDTVEDRLGQVTYDNYFWDRRLKDALQLGIRSVGWNAGFVRLVPGGVKDITAGRWKTYSSTYIMALAMMTGLAGSLVYWMLHGKEPESIKDTVYIPTGQKNEDGEEERMVLPSYMRDVGALARHPLTTLEHKLNPIFGLLHEAWTNRDFYGNEIRNEDDPVVQQMQQIADYLAKQFIPFGIRNATQEGQQGQGLTQKALPFIGVTPAPREVVRSPDENMMAKYYERRGRPALTPEEAEKSQQRRTAHGELRDLTRAPDAGTNDKIPEYLEKKVASGEMTAAQAKASLRTAGEPPHIKNFRQLPLDVAMRTYEIATPARRADYYELFARKIQGAENTQYDLAKKADGMLESLEHGEPTPVSGGHHRGPRPPTRRR